MTVPLPSKHSPKKPRQKQPRQEQRSEQLAKFQGGIGHRFNDLDLLELALTHKSWAFENQPSESSERLEILGDAVLSTCVLQHLYRNYPHLVEGEMSQVRSAVVRGSTLAEVALRYQVGAVLKLGKGEERDGGRKKPSLLEDALEAIIAAVYLDAGEAAAANLVMRLLGGIIETVIAELPLPSSDSNNPAPNDLS